MSLKSTRPPMVYNHLPMNGDHLPGAEEVMEVGEEVATLPRIDIIPGILAIITVPATGCNSQNTVPPGSASRGGIINRMLEETDMIISGTINQLSRLLLTRVLVGKGH